MSEVPVEIPHPRLRGWSPWLLATLVVLGLGVGLRLGALDVGFIGDDHAHRAMVEGRFGAPRASLDLFSWYVDTDAERASRQALGALPWWSEDGLSVRVLRPLTSLTVWIDQTLFPGRAGPQHLHSMLWWVGVLVTFMGLAWRRLGPMPAILGGLVLACDPAATTPVGWIANRAALICALLGWLTLELEWAADQSPRLRWAAAACFAGALLGGEYALAMLGPLLARALLSAPDWRSRAVAGGPYLGLAVLYLAVHRGLGFGSTSGQLYADPIARPLAWLGLALARVPVLLGQLVLSCMASLRHLELRVTEELGPSWAEWWFSEGVEAAAWTHVAVGGAALLFAVALAALAWRGLRDPERGAALWLGLGALLALVPMAAAPAHGRLLLIPGLAYSAHLGLVLTGLGRQALGWRAREELETPGIVRRGLGWVLLLALLALHLLGDGRWNPRELEDLRRQSERDARTFDSDALAEVDLEGRDVVLVSAAGFDMVSFGAFFSHDFRGQAPRSWQSLSMLDGPLVMRRVGERRIELHPLVGGQVWLETRMEGFFRPRDVRFSAGDELEHAGIAIQVLTVDEDGRPTGLSFRFPHRLERYTWLTAGPDGLLPVRLPRVRGAAPIPAPALPLGQR